MVVFGAPVVLTRAPFGADQTIPLHTLKSEKQRPRIYTEHAFADLLDALRDAEPVHWLQAQALENEHVERALNDVRRLRHAQ